MRFAIFLFITVTSINSSATIYRCKSGENVGFLHLAKNFMSWEERDLGNFAIGKSLGGENVDFNRTNAYVRYLLPSEEGADLNPRYVSVNSEALFGSDPNFDLYTFNENANRQTNLLHWDCKEVR